MKHMFHREKKAGELIFAVLFFAFSAFLFFQIPNETVWKNGMQLFSQPSFWPRVSLSLMTVFAALFLMSSFVSPRLEGRWKEVGTWVASVEYVAWFLGYVALVPILGYLFCTMAFPMLLTFRAGYRSFRWALISASSGLIIVLIFKTALRTKIPGGAVYEYLPDAARSFMLTYF